MPQTGPPSDLSPLSPSSTSLEWQIALLRQVPECASACQSARQKRPDATEGEPHVSNDKWLGYRLDLFRMTVELRLLAVRLRAKRMAGVRRKVA